MTKPISMEDRRNWPNRVGRKFDKFWQMKLPCPVDPVEDIYRAAWTEKEWTCIRYLRQEKPEALQQRDTFSLFWTDDTSGNSKCPHVTFPFPKGTSFPYHPVMLDDLPEKTRTKVRSWIVSVNAFRSLRRELVARCKGVMGNPTGVGDMWQRRTFKYLDPKCGSVGQLYRLWPEIQPFFFPQWKSGVRQISVKSRLPTELGYRVSRQGEDGVTRQRWCTPEEFRAEDAGATVDERRRFERINHILTMVSLAQDVPMNDSYPLFYGTID